MFTSSPMELISIVVLKDKAEEVASRLLTLGVFHPIDIRTIEDDLNSLTPFQMQAELSEWEALEYELRDLARNLNCLIHPARDVSSFSLEQMRRGITALKEKVTPLIEKRKEIEENIKTKVSMNAQIRDALLFPLKRTSYTFLDVNLGKIEEKNLGVLERSLHDIPYVLYPVKKEGTTVVALVIGLRRDRAVIERVLRDLAWREIEYSSESPEVSADLEKKIAVQIEELRHTIHGIDAEIKTIAGIHSEEIEKMYSYIALKKSIFEAKKYFCTTEKTIVLSGWVPRQDKEKVIGDIKGLTVASFVETKKSEDVCVPKDEIPVRMEHSPFFKPFELLITSYGVPRYGSIDPTIFTAISFLLMFGAMFGDVGQGFVFVLAGLLLRRNAKKVVKQASALVLYCGIMSVIFGILYGSAFGLEFHPLWAKPAENIVEFFRISVIFGIAFISLGIIFNVINSLKDKNYLKAFFDKAGLVGGLVYWASIGLVIKMFVMKSPLPLIYLLLISVGLVILFFKPVIEKFLRKKKKESAFEALMEGGVDLMEIFMGYLANTVSFIRIAAFALAHAGLLVAIFELA
ncbi:MAG: V-type ATPase 116kDa subunit family protein, partial [Candidatus Omnitrophica bacterium]|nr:V-type ATPase 116kDa subunit family protein [Candidatus Omnitrophota bacterium]